MTALIQQIVLWIHLVTAAFLVGGSLFVWLVLIPASYRIAANEAERTRLVGAVARQFGRIAAFDFLLLVASGVYNATWYLGSLADLFTSQRGILLLVKIILVALLLGATLVHDLFFSRRISRLAAEGKIEELRATRRKSRVVSFLSLLFMVGVLVMVVLMQGAA